MAAGPNTSRTDEDSGGSSVLVARAIHARPEQLRSGEADDLRVRRRGGMSSGSGVQPVRESQHDTGMNVDSQLTPGVCLELLTGDAQHLPDD